MDIDIQKFEYSTLSFHNLTDEEIDQSVVEKLSKLGEQGWELISVVPEKIIGISTTPNIY